MQLKMIMSSLASNVNGCKVDTCQPDPRQRLSTKYIDPQGSFAREGAHLNGPQAHTMIVCEGYLLHPSDDWCNTISVLSVFLEALLPASLLIKCSLIAEVIAAILTLPVRSLKLYSRSICPKTREDAWGGNLTICLPGQPA